jgi:hypothetical protein
VIFIGSGADRGFFKGSWGKTSFFSPVLSGVSNLMSFLSGSGRFSFCSPGLSGGGISEIFWGVSDESL